MEDSENFYENDWGNKKTEYYARNKTKKDDDNYIEEEEEAIKIQQAKLKKLKEVNLLNSDEENDDNEQIKKTEKKVEKYNLDSSSESEEEKNKPKKGRKKVSSTPINKMDAEEQIQILKNIKIHLDEVEENVNPILEILNNEEKDLKLNLKESKEYLKRKGKMHLLYVVYMLFYSHFKNQGKITDHHPVIKKMFVVKSLIEGSKDPDEAIFKEIDKILKLIEANKILQEDIEDDLKSEENSEESENKFLNKKRGKDLTEENRQYINKLKNQKLKNEKQEKINVWKEVENKNEMGQRLANEQIIKARGIVRKRKKYQGNAKLHNREKYHKKQMQRKNYVKEYEGKPQVYGGEATGIRRDLIRSTKFK